MELEMQCNCGAEGFVPLEERRFRIFKRLGISRMGDLIETVLLSLWLDFGCDDAWIGADMWFGVSVSTPLEPERVHVQCDEPSDGFLAVWEELARLHPERVTVNPGRTEGSLRVAQRISEVLLQRYVDSERDYEEHRAHAHKDGSCPPCEDCDVLGTLRAHDMVTLEQAWGCRVLDPAVEASWD